MDMNSHYILQKESFNNSKKKKFQEILDVFGIQAKSGLLWATFLTLWFSGGSSK
jgi:hypothetical protein